jgi:hypothetical protein
MVRDAGPKVRRLLHWLSLDRPTEAKGEMTHSTQDDWVSPDFSNHWFVTRIGDLSRLLCFALSRSRDGEIWEMELHWDENDPRRKGLWSISPEPSRIIPGATLSA